MNWRGQNFDRQLELFEKNVASKASFDTATHNIETTRQAFAGAEAGAEHTYFLYCIRNRRRQHYGGTLPAELGSAELDLSNTTVVTTDGYVTQLFLRPGMVVNVSTPTMVFVHSDPNVLTASFAQGALQRLKAGNEAEIAFDAIPGRIFKAKVTVVIDAIAQTCRPNGALLNLEDRSKSSGRATTLIEILDDLSSLSVAARCDRTSCSLQRALALGRRHSQHHSADELLAASS